MASSVTTASSLYCALVSALDEVETLTCFRSCVLNGAGNNCTKGWSIFITLSTVSLAAGKIMCARFHTSSNLPVRLSAQISGKTAMKSVPRY